MLIFGNDQHARGCFTELMYRITGDAAATFLDLAGETFPAKNAARTPFIVSAIGFAQKEKYNIVQCFAERNYTYAFGHDAASSTLEVTLTSFLTNATGTAFGLSLLQILTAYDKARLSKYKKYVTLTIGRASMQGFLAGITSSTADPEHNLQSVTLLILLVEPQSQAAGG